MELKNAKDFNEEYVVFLTATVNFRSSIDVSGEPDYVQAPEARFFQKDSPGQVFRSGMVRFVPWQPDSPLMQDINDFDISLYFPDFDRAEGVNPLPALSEVGLRSGAATLMLEIPEQLPTQENYVVCQLLAQPASEGAYPHSEVLGHRFLICRTWLLSDMELMYASFCRMNGIAMRKMDAETLERFDIMTQKDELKVVPHLRAAMVFERPAYKQRWGCCGVCLPTGLNAEDRLGSLIA